MREEQSDLFLALDLPNHRVALSTNGFIKRNGQGVMGRGCALQAALMYPGLPLALGRSIKSRGNVPCYITVGSNQEACMFMILPVKHNWWEQADRGLIITSRDFLMGEAVHHPAITFHVPRLGCGNGRLNWERHVRPLMEILPDNVVVHS